MGAFKLLNTKGGEIIYISKEFKLNYKRIAALISYSYVNVKEFLLCGDAVRRLTISGRYLLKCI